MGKDDRDDKACTQLQRALTVAQPQPPRARHEPSQEGQHRCQPENSRFDQDFKQIVVRMAKPGEKTYPDSGAGVIALAPVGAKPGLLTAETYQVTATVTGIDTRKQKVTLQIEDGTSRKFPVRKDVDLAKRKVGEKVVIEMTETFAILMEKP